MNSKNKVHALVQKAYGDVARKGDSCCKAAQTCCRGPQGAGESLGELGLSCGNPVAFSRLRPGQTVLDLGSGAGRDVFLAAQAVGPGGRVIGVDMTPDMIALARKNAAQFARETGLDNVEFREGIIERLPVEDSFVDVVISNCVINLSPDKPAVFQEICRVLKPSGKMIVSDIVLNRSLPEDARSNTNLYTACVAGALLREDYISAIRGAGFQRIEILTDALYSAAQVGGDPLTEVAAEALQGAASSVTILACK